MCARTPVTSVNFRVLLTFPRLSHMDCFLYFLFLWRLFLFIVGFVFPVSTPYFSIFKVHCPESHPSKAELTFMNHTCSRRKSRPGVGVGWRRCSFFCLWFLPVSPQSAFSPPSRWGWAYLKRQIEVLMRGLRKSGKGLSTFLWTPGFALSLDIT